MERQLNDTAQKPPSINENLMEMNPFKPFIQICGGLYEKNLSKRISINKIYLKISSIKATI